MFKLLSYLLVSEVLFNPFPSGADYVELYNNSGDTISLADIRLAKMADGAITKLYPISGDYRVAPHDYVVVTTDAQNVKDCYRVPFPEKIVEVPSMPSYPDAGGVVAVATADSVLLDLFSYDEKMHSRLLHDVEGVSIERRSFEVETDNPNNWFSAASTTMNPNGCNGMGTPTARNSQSTEFMFLEQDFRLEPEIFSPDGDGYNDLLDITYQLEQPDLSANINVFDSKGRLVRHLMRGGVLGTSGVITWDGLDDAGVRCLRGRYNIVIEAFNTTSTKQISKKSVTLVVK